ncbi:DUF2254 domain-containing protein [Streptococcus sp. CSL10205-OR2]|uniref:DUF2254 domain-containing protein n=1 Tax=Streptococcus sp. CSL10205-OR2 TaxID=2980558 RepID=UPI0021DA346A|nr:DUF2254 domain-containing protein [Streptococcus sp. CSL10205-OR2]MCU9533732.1 DUF2254 domain-containing protein [Streptococcus sp. CSL10205-OR2]
MFERLKLWYYNHKAWIYNTQYILYSIVLVNIVMLVDLGYFDVKDYIPSIFYTKVSLAKTILATLAGAQLTITTFTFSTILSVMSNYMSNFSPRVVENFVDTKITMKVLGIFFGGFFYSITALVFMRDVLEDQQVIAGFVSVVYAIVSMIYFIIFVQNVIRSSKSENLLSDIYTVTLSVIEKELDKREEYQGFFSDIETQAIQLYPNANGFLSVINFGEISDLLKDHNAELIVDCKIGDFINEEKPLAHINKAESTTFDDDLMSKIADCFILSENKVYENDYRHGIDKIEEIAVRALSPGVNDPNTAIQCIHKISLLLVPISKTVNNHIIVQENANAKIAYTAYTFEEDLYHSFNQIINYGKEDIDVMYTVLEGLETLYYSAVAANKKAVLDLVKDMYEHIIPKPSGQLNKERLDYIYQRILTKSQEIAEA